MIVDEDRKVGFADSIYKLMMRNDVANISMKRDIHAMHALRHGVSTEETRTVKVSFDVVIREENVDH